MKILSIFAAIWLAAVLPAAAQDSARSPVSRGDAHFVVGWQNLNQQHSPQPSNDWMNAILFGGAGAGWYWTDHLKTQVDIGAGTTGRQYRYEPVVINGQMTGLSSRLAVRKRSVAVSQQYQFLRNRWFHPYLGAGADIAQETMTQEFSPVVLYDNLTRISREVRPARTQGPDVATVVRPFVAGGFKAYMTRRAFFIADGRLMLREQVDEVLFRVGFGVDF